MTDSGPKVNIHPSASPDPLQVQGSGRTNELERANEDLKSAQAESQRRWQYLAEAQKLSHSGTFGWKVSSGELVWSDETYRILGFTRETNPTLDLVFDRIHPEDRAGLQEIRDRATQSGIDLNVEHRLVTPDGVIKHVHVVAHAGRDSSGSLEYMGVVTEDLTRLVIVGATGMVGSYALRYALDHPAVGSVTAVGRKKLGISHPKLKEVLHQDFADCFALADVLSGQDAAIFCLGVYTGAVPDAEFRKITVDYTIEFSRVLRASSSEASFSFLSGSGADPTGRSRMAFARYKGQAENALTAAGFPRLYIFRPAYIYPVEPRKEPNLSYRMLRAIYPLFQVLFPNQVIRADDLARTMVDVVVRRAGESRALVLENRDIRALVESLPHPRV